MTEPVNMKNLGALSYNANLASSAKKLKTQECSVSPFENGAIENLQKRKTGKSGITFDLKAAFDGLVKAGALERKDKTFTKKDALAMYNKLQEIHKKNGYSTDFNKMKAGQEYTYSAADYQALAEAAGYSLKGSSEAKNGIDIKS